MSEHPKPKRTKDPKVIQEVQKNYCERCGSPAYGEPHHIRPRSLGGPDIKENLIQLCRDCHLLAQEYKIPVVELLKIVARREEKTVEEISRLTQWNLVLPEGADDQEESGGQKLSDPVRAALKDCRRLINYSDDSIPCLDEAIQLFVMCKEHEEDGKWGQAAVLVILRHGFGMKTSRVSSECGISPSLVREMTRTFLAFSDETTRVAELSFYHHRLAATRTDDPQKWIALAADNGWSTRQMVEQIKLAECTTEEQQEEAVLGKAERAFRMVCEVMETGGEPATWLERQLENLLFTSTAKAGNL